MNDFISQEQRDQSRELKIGKFLKFLFAYVTIVGLVTFSLFIMEESIQMITFGTWPAQDAQNWEVVLAGTVAIDKANATMNLINNIAGWIQPLAFISYRSYSKSASYYTSALKGKIFAHRPELLVGHHVETSLFIKEIERIGKDSYLIKSGKVRVLTNHIPPGTHIHLSGVPVLVDSQVMFQKPLIYGNTILES